MAVTTRDITGKVLDPSRTSALDGEYRFTPTQEIRTSAGDIIPTRPIVAPFYKTPPDGSGLTPGQFKVTLIANDSADLEQAAATYRVELFLAARPDRLQGSPINIVVPKTGTGDLQLSKLVPVTLPGEVVPFLTESVADDRYVQPAVLLDYVRAEDLEPVDLTPYATKVQAQAAQDAADAAQGTAAAAGTAAGNAQTTATAAAGAAGAAATAAAGAAARVSSLLLVQAGTPDAMVTGAIVRDSNGAATGFDVVWPDGATGRFTGTASSSFPGAIDAYAITHIVAPGGSANTTTYTQAAVTRDANGAVTARPAITVA